MVNLTAIHPVNWDGKSLPCLGIDAVEFQLTALSGGVWKPKRSFDGVLWDDCSIYRGTVEYTSLSVNDIGKIFKMLGKGWVKLELQSGNYFLTASAVAAKIGALGDNGGICWAG